MKSSRIISCTSGVTLLIACSFPASAETWGSNPWSSGFSPMNMGSNPWSSGFSPMSMGMNPWSAGFSPMIMGSNPWSSGFSPFNMGNNPWSAGSSPWSGGNSSIWPWGNNLGGGNAWGNNAWMPWMGSSGASGRRNNGDWVTSMFLMNSLNNQQPWSMGMPPNYPYQPPAWSQGVMPTPQSQPMLSYPQQPALPNAMTSMPQQSMQPTVGLSNFPNTTSSFSPFMTPSTAETLNSATIQQPNPASANPIPTRKTVVFPDGSQF